MSKNKIIIYLFFLFLVIYLFIASFIGTNKFNYFRSLLNNQQKTWIKNYIFPYKTISEQRDIINDQVDKIFNLNNKLKIDRKNLITHKKSIIKTDGNHSFKLKSNDNLFFYSIGYRETNIKITGVLKDKNIECYKNKSTNSYVKDGWTIFKNSHKIKLNELSQKCKEAIFFIGKFNDKNFYFRLKQEKKKRKNLLVLPTTNFYLYADSNLDIEPYNQSEDYIINLSDIPLKINDVWAYKTSQSIHNITNKVVKDFDIILDYEFQSFELKDYDLIIFPLHQEYVSDEFIEKFQDFLKKDNKVVLSIGGSNFQRDFKIKDEIIIIQKNKFKDNKLYNLNTFYPGLNKNCIYLDDAKFILGEVTEPLIRENIEYFFPKIKCDNGKVIPMLSIQTFNKSNNSKLIHILSDSIGINFKKIKYLELKIVKEINNIINN